ncbi:uncharacterized protein [Periplaneta americana]|uniref:uncharacterized protein isoform X2 n=1 Tax=Periplaneta americana TaxID=6978 RepID=UPI0037E8BD65
MSRFETPGQVVLLFACAALVSVILIALLNVEAKNRKIKEPEIENGNLFQALGKQIVRWTKRWRHHNTSITDGSGLNRAKRSLKAIRHDGDGDDPAEHPVRHHGKHRRKLEPRSRRLGAHDACYNTNQVLLIIAVTCAVNFAFIFTVMTLVHVCNRSGGKLDGLDTVVLAENGDCDSHDHKISPDGASIRRETASYTSVQEYVNSLPSSFDRTASMLSLHSLHAARNHSQENLLRKSNSLHTSFSMEDLLFVG